jgi:hypothetical protein
MMAGFEPGAMRRLETKKAAEAAFTVESAGQRPTAVGLLYRASYAVVGLVGAAAGTAAVDFDP